MSRFGDVKNERDGVMQTNRLRSNQIQREEGDVADIPCGEGEEDGSEVEDDVGDMDDGRAEAKMSSRTSGSQSGIRVPWTTLINATLSSRVSRSNPDIRCCWSARASA